MKFNITLIQPRNYIHSYSVLELCQLLHFSLVELGHSSSLSRNHFEHGAINIVFCGHLMPPEVWKQLPPDLIFINSEQLPNNELGWISNIFGQASTFRMVEYSELNAKVLSARIDAQVPVWKIGFHPGMRRIIFDREKDIDVLFYGSINPRRQTILQSLKESGLKIKHLFGVYGFERDQWVARSKVVLNLHYYDAKIFEIVRVFYLLTNSVPVVAEISKETKIAIELNEAVEGAEYDDLKEVCQEICSDPVKTSELGAIGYEIFSKMPQREFTEELLDQLSL